LAKHFSYVSVVKIYVNWGGGELGIKFPNRFQAEPFFRFDGLSQFSQNFENETIIAKQQ
jgi:hypothetical protein